MSNPGTPLKASRLPAVFRPPALPFRALRLAAVGGAQAALVALLAGWALPNGRFLALIPTGNASGWAFDVAVVLCAALGIAAVAFGPIGVVLALTLQARAVTLVDRADAKLGVWSTALASFVLWVVDAPLPVLGRAAPTLPSWGQLSIALLAVLGCAGGIGLFLVAHARRSLREAFVARAQRGEEPRFRVDAGPTGDVLVRTSGTSEENYRGWEEDAEMFALPPTTPPSERESAGQ